jgi:hypothetical protein
VTPVPARINWISSGRMTPPPPELSWCSGAPSSVGQDLHVSVTVGVEPGAGLHLNIVDHPQGPESPVRGVVVLPERVSAVEPAPVGASAGVGESKTWIIVSPSFFDFTPAAAS